MPASLDCPEMECWEALFRDALPPGERERCERHLDSCPRCQECLDRPEEFGESLRQRARRVGDPTVAPPDPAWGRFVERMLGVRAAAPTAVGAPADLYFLRPADRPGCLGTLGPYVVERVIGQGGMGVVLKASDPALHRSVAIKVLAAAVAGSATARQRFKREAQAAAAVCHEHIIAVHGVHEADGLPYLVMQYVAGESLQQRLDRAGPLEVVEVVRIGLQAASGLAAAHAQGLIHRDVKPANILLEDGLARVKITDFGLARTADDAGLTRAGVVAGTPEYMAPEQARGEQVDPRADLFSLGSVLYACCTGHPPFRASTPLAVLRQVNEQAPAPIRSLNPDVPAWLEALINRLLAKDPAQRFQSAAEVATLLEGYLAHLRQPATVPAPELPPSPSDGRSGLSEARPRTGAGERFLRRPWPAALALLAVLGLGVVVWGLAAGGRGPAPEPPAPARRHRVYDFRTRIDDLPGLTLFGPDAESVVRTDAQGLRINLPEGRPDCNSVGVELPLTIRGDFDIDLGYELLAIGDNIPDPAAGVQLRLAFDDPSIPLVALARFRNRYGPQSARLFQVVGHDGETFAAYRITILPNAKESPKGVDVRAREPRGRLKLVRTGPRLDYLVSDGESPYHLIRSEEVGGADVETLRLVGFSGWGPVAVDVRFTDLVIDADRLPDAGPGEMIPGRMAWSKAWLAAALVVGLLISLPLGVWLCLWARRRPAADGPAQPGAAARPGSFPCPACGDNLRARAGMAGKRVKCPRCATAVLVPGTGADG